jgi:hypothetical protein
MTDDHTPAHSAGHEAAVAADHKPLHEALTSARRSRRLFTAFAAAFVAALIALAAALWLVAHNQDKHVDALRTSVAANSAALHEANHRLAANGQPTVAVPSVGPAGQEGPPGPGPSAAEVQQAVDLYCSGGICNGHGPSRSEVAAAVVTYCNVRGDCQGPKGGTGAPGDIGATGPGPSDPQVASAVAGYCDAHNQCQGPSGSDGSNGTDGRDGKDAPTITAVAFSGNAAACELDVTLSDSTVLTTPVPGSFCIPPPS